jgi:hypothetical protein
MSKIDRSDELRVAFLASAKKNTKMTPKQLVDTLGHLGFPPLTPEIKSGLVASFNVHGGFDQEDFVKLALTMGFEEIGEKRYSEAIDQIAEDSLVDCNLLERLLVHFGCGINLSPEEAKAFLMFQLGERDYKRPRITKEKAHQLIN